MNPMYAVLTSGHGRLFALLLASMLVQVGCAGAQDDTRAAPKFDCDQHSPEEVMPGLAKFRGDPEAGSIGSAIQKYREAASSEEIPRAEAKYCIGKLLFDSGDPQRADQYFSEAIELEPSAHEAYFARGVLRRGLGRCVEAISDFDAVAQVGGTGFGLSVEAAKAYYDCGAPQEALKEINAAERILPGDELTFGLLLIKARVLTELDRYDEAFRYASEAVDRMQRNGLCASGSGLCRSPDLVAAVDVLSNVLCARGDAERARQLYQQYRHYSHPAPQVPRCLDY